MPRRRVATTIDFNSAQFFDGKDYESDKFTMMRAQNSRTKKNKNNLQKQMGKHAKSSKLQISDATKRCQQVE